MTNEELLSAVDYIYLQGQDGALIDSLRAVVKLHKPITEDLSSFNEGHTEDKDFVDFCNLCQDIEYPCPTIQTIENQLLLK